MNTIEIISELNELQADLNTLNFYLEDTENTPFKFANPNKTKKEISARIKELEKSLHIN